MPFVSVFSSSFPLFLACLSIAVSAVRSAFMNKLKGGRGRSIKSSRWSSFNGDGRSDKDFLLKRQLQRSPKGPLLLSSGLLGSNHWSFISIFFCLFHLRNLQKML